MLPKELVKNNPWWSDPAKIDSDPLLVRLSESAVKWEPEIMRDFDFGDFVYSLRGPRRIGKTTAIKALIRELLDKGVPTWNVMYCEFGSQDGPKDMVSLIKDYLDNTADNRGKDRCYLFLDEISSVRGWQKGVKRLWDQKRLSNCTVIAAGSHVVDLKRSAERLPGRRGEIAGAADKAMLPMKFSEFVSVMDPEIARIVETSGAPSREKRSLSGTCSTTGCRPSCMTCSPARRPSTGTWTTTC